MVRKFVVVGADDGKECGMVVKVTKGEDVDEKDRRVLLSSLRLLPSPGQAGRHSTKRCDWKADEQASL